MSRLGGIAAAVAGIGGLDGVQSIRTWPVPIMAALDWPAHVATAALVLAAAPWRLPPETAAWALVGSVAIDVDHVPLYLGLDRIAGDDQRPLSHSLTTTAALFAGSRFARGRRRTALVGLAAPCCTSSGTSAPGPGYRCSGRSPAGTCAFPMRPTSRQWRWPPWCAPAQSAHRIDGCDRRFTHSGHRRPFLALSLRIPLRVDTVTLR